MPFLQSPSPSMNSRFVARNDFVSRETNSKPEFLVRMLRRIGSFSGVLQATTLKSRILVC